VRILRVGAKAQAFRPTTESWKAQRDAAVQRVAGHVEKKRVAEREWIAKNYPKAAGPADGVLTEELAAGQKVDPGPTRVRYRGSAGRYVGHVLGREGPPLEVIRFGSTASGVPGYIDPPEMFTLEPGKTKINPGLDGAIAAMAPGERRVVIVPAALAYGRAGFYSPEIAGTRRLIISPNTMLVYDVEVSGTGRE